MQIVDKIKNVFINGKILARSIVNYVRLTITPLALIACDYVIVGCVFIIIAVVLLEYSEYVFYAMLIQVFASCMFMLAVFVREQRMRYTELKRSVKSTCDPLRFRMFEDTSFYPVFLGLNFIVSVPLYTCIIETAPDDVRNLVYYPLYTFPCTVGRWSTPSGLEGPMFDIILTGYHYTIIIFILGVIWCAQRRGRAETALWRSTRLSPGERWLILEERYFYRTFFLLNATVSVLFIVYATLTFPEYTATLTSFDFDRTGFYITRLFVYIDSFAFVRVRTDPLYIFFIIVLTIMCIREEVLRGLGAYMEEKGIPKRLELRRGIRDEEIIAMCAKYFEGEESEKIRMEEFCKSLMKYYTEKEEIIKDEFCETFTRSSDEEKERRSLKKFLDEREVVRLCIKSLNETRKRNSDR